MGLKLRQGGAQTACRWGWDADFCIILAEEEESRFMNTEELRQQLLEEIYAGAMAGMPAMLLDEDAIRQADSEELQDIAQRYGISI